MKKFKSLIAAVMAATMVLTMTGCDEETGPEGGGSAPTANNNNSGAGTSATTDRKDMEDEAVTNAAKALKDKVSYPDLKVTKRIKWMSWWDMDETSGEAELFKEVYGIPETGDDAASAGRIFEFTNVEYKSRFDKLSMAISGDDSPDMFPFDIIDFPYGVLMNRYQPVDDIVNFSEDKWQATKDLNDQFALNGKHYTAFWGITLQDLMWYKKSNIEAIGVDDPQELFKQGKWDWDAFLDMGRKWQQTGTETDPKFLLDGYSAEDEFVITTGTPVIGTDGTKLVSNMRSANVERAITGIITTLQKENLRYPRHELNDWTQNPAAWASDQILFFCEGTWRYEDELQVFKRKYKWADDEIRVVPFPKDPKADKYYVQVKVDVPMWVKGSKNKEGVQAWLDCCVVTSADETLKKASDAKMIKNPKQNYTQELLDFLNPLYARDGSSPLTPIVEFKRGLGPNVFDGDSIDSPVYAITAIPYLTATDSFVTLRDSNEAAIVKAMEDINARITE